VLGTDGTGARNLIVPRGGMRAPLGGEPLPETTDESGNVRTEANLYMNGPAILEFTIRRVPAVVKELLAKAGLTMDDIQHVVLHQANEYMLTFLKKQLKVPDEKFAVHFADCGNTVSSTIPIVLQHLDRQWPACERRSHHDRRLRRGLLVGRESHHLEPWRMTRTEFIDGLRRTLEWPELSEDTELKGNERWDSLAQVDVVMFAQDELGQTLSTVDLQSARTMRDVLRLVEGQLAAG